MNEISDKKRKIKNSDVIKRTLFSLIYVARLKTSKDYAWSIIKNLLTELKKDHDFLKYISIDEIKNIKDTIDDITVSSDFNNIDSNKIGEVIQNIVDIFKTRMGVKAGYFFLTEFKDKLGDEYHTVIKKMGVDLRLIDLQYEIYGWDSGKYKIKDKHDTNIAYLEKTE